MALFEGFARSSTNPAVHVEGVTLTYGELEQRARDYLGALRSEGAAAGDRIGVVATPGIATVVAFVGHALGGLVSVPINPATGDAELDHVLIDAAPRWVATTDVAFRARLAGRVRIVDPGAASGRRSGADEGDPHAPLVVLYTSGTTGRPKGAVLTRANVESNLDALAAAWRLEPSDTVVHALPLFHVHGLVLGLFGPLRLGAQLSWVTRFSPLAVASELSRTRGVLYAVPTMHHRLAEAAQGDASVRAGLAAARLLVSGSAPLSDREHRRIEALAGQRVLERYGLTETLIDCAMRAGERAAVGTVGPAVSGVEVELVDDARTPILARDGATIGEVRVRGPNVFSGYLNRPDATAAVMDAAGWFYTGDLATMDAERVVRIVGRRATDLIKTGGFKVGAGEIESALLEHAAVREAAVLGAADDDLGERIVAWVALQPGAMASERELVDHVVRLLAAHKRPREVHFVNDLPRNAMGKILKSKLAATRVVPK